VSLISVFVFIFVLVDLFYTKAPFGRAWLSLNQIPRRLPLRDFWEVDMEKVYYVCPSDEEVGGLCVSVSQFIKGFVDNMKYFFN
jgi:hypothetical protein